MTGALVYGAFVLGASVAFVFGASVFGASVFGAAVFGEACVVFGAAGTGMVVGAGVGPWVGAPAVSGATMGSSIVDGAGVGTSGTSVTTYSVGTGVTTSKCDGAGVAYELDAGVEWKVDDGILHSLIGMSLKPKHLLHGREAEHCLQVAGGINRYTVQDEQSSAPGTFRSGVHL